MPEMMADGTSGTLTSVPVAREIDLPGEPGAWVRLGFTPGAPVGELRTAPGSTHLQVGVEGLAAERPDGLALVSADGPAGAGAAHPNGAEAVDHVVALTDDMERTLAALRAAGLDLRRRREPPEAPVRQAFLHLGTLILEVAEAPGRTPALWGLVVVVGDLDRAVRDLGPLLGTPRDAVQPGRRIATVRREAGIPTALAFMTPRPQRSPAA
jgi:hypothetical protein